MARRQLKAMRTMSRVHQDLAPLQVEPLDQKLDFGTGVDHMNQVLSFDRLVYFGYIFEQAGLAGNK